MNKIYTRKQLQELEVAEEYFRTVINCQYKRNTSKQINDKVADILEETVGHQVTRNYGCAHCCFKLFKEAGEIYFKSKQYYNELDTKETEPTNNNQPETETATNKKRGRKKYGKKEEGNNN